MCISIEKVNSSVSKHKLSSFFLITFLVITLLLLPSNQLNTARSEPVSLTIGGLVVSAAVLGAVIGAGTYALGCIIDKDQDFSTPYLIAHMTTGAVDGVVMLVMAWFSAGAINLVCGAITVPGVSSYFGDKLGGVFDDIGNEIQTAKGVFSAEFENALNSLSSTIEQRISSSLQALESANGTNIEVTNNLPVWANLGESILTSGISITTNGTDYSDIYSTRRMLYPGSSYIEAQFSLSEIDDHVCLTLVHLSSADQATTNGGYSPVDIYINGVLFQNNYDVAQAHGDHLWHEDNWQIGSYLQKGNNIIRIELEDNPWAETHYWFRYLSIRAGSLSSPDISHTITASSDPNGSIDPEGDVYLNQGRSQTFEAIPDSGYEVDQWKQNGIHVQTGGSTYTLSNIQEDTIISVAFNQVSSGTTFSISTAAEFIDYMTNPAYLDEKFKLTADINLNDLSNGADTVFTAAIIAPDKDNNQEGYQGTPFTGKFDGQGFAIRNINIDATGTENDYLGLFGKIGVGGRVSNLKLTSGTDIRAGDNSEFVGGIAGYNDGGYIKNCEITSGKISVNNNCKYLGRLVGSDKGGFISDSHAVGSVLCGTTTFCAGGLIGKASSTDINNCSATGNVRGDQNSQYLGGLIGSATECETISNSFATGWIEGNEGSSYLGGLIGGAYDDCIISRCYSTGEVRSDDPDNAMSYAGGLVGWLEKSDIIESYSTSSINTHDTTCVGGLTGYNHDGAAINRSYFQGSIYGDDYIGGLTGRNFKNCSIINSYAKGSINGIEVIGGIVGENKSECNVTNCYSATIINVSSSAGGIVYYNDQSSVNNCYFLDTSAPDNSFGLPLTDRQMTSSSSYSGWDFNNIWHSTPDAYPLLTWQVQWIIVPDFVDLSQASAESAITSTGLTVGTITEAYSNTISAGNVISQSLTVGSLVANSSTVDLIISLGQLAIPILSVTPESISVNSSNGTTTCAVNNTGTGIMPWAASVTSGESWLSIASGSSGTDNGIITASFTENTLASYRTGTISITTSGTFISQQNVLITQAGVACTYAISPTGNSFASSVGTDSLSVSTQTDCEWTAISNDSWISITSGSSGVGNESVNYSVSSNSGDNPRTGTMTIAGNTFSVTQDGLKECTYSISSSGNSHSSSGETGTVNVATQVGCGWTATSNDSWISITSGSSGVGNESVNYSVSSNSGDNPRTGTMTIAGNTFTVNQDVVECSYSISPTGKIHDSSGGDGSLSISTQSGCDWTATSNDSWITITSGNNGTGNGTVNYSLSLNPNSDLRTGTLTVAGNSFTVTQNGSTVCTYSISSSGKSHSSSAETGTVNIVTQTECDWNATSNDSWITITSGNSGTGNGTVNYSLSLNPNSDLRTGTMTVAGNTFSVTQNGPAVCTYSISSSGKAHGSSTETGTVSVVTQSECDWTATSNDSWVSIDSGNSGTGNGTVNYSVFSNPNTGSRTGTMTIAGNTFTVTQEGTPTYDTKTELKCISDKVKASSKLCADYLNCYAKQIKNSNINIDTCFSKAEEKFAGSWDKAETKASAKNEDCTTTADTANEDIVVLAIEDIYNQVCDGLDLKDGNSNKLAQSLFKNIGKRVSGLLKAESANIKNSDSGNLETVKFKVLSKFKTSWDKSISKAQIKGVAYAGPSISEVENLTDDLISDILNSIIGTPCSDNDGDGVCEPDDLCPTDPDKTSPGTCGCGVSDADADSDGTSDCNDNCPNDTNKIEPGSCGCGVADVDTDSDGTLDCNDQCPNDPDKTDAGTCGCGVSDIDSDSDGTPDCNDNCPDDPDKTAPGVCGCGVTDTDSDSDGTPDCAGDECPNDPDKNSPGICGCGVSDIDTDSDGTPDCNDNCPNDADKVEPGGCGCGTADTDTDSDGTPDCNDNCPNDPNKITPGTCGCGFTDNDTDTDGTPDCNDNCPNDPNKIEPGTCGCGTTDADTDSDGTVDCNDSCPNDAANDADGDGICGDQDNCPNQSNASQTDADGDGIGDICDSTPCEDDDGDGTCNSEDGCPDDPNKVAPGDCGCGNADTDSDSDGTPDCNDSCPNDAANDIDGDGICGDQDNCPNHSNASQTDTDGDGIGDVCDSTPCEDDDGDGTCNSEDGCPDDPNKIAPGDCGCGTADTDSDSDGTPDCNDGCPNDPNQITPGVCGCNPSDSDSDGTPDCIDQCPDDPNKITLGNCGCGVADTDSDSDGSPDCIDQCPDDPNKIESGDCGCGIADTDSDSDGTPNCNDLCPDDPNKIEPGNCGCGFDENCGPSILIDENFESYSLNTWPSSWVPDANATNSTYNKIVQDPEDSSNQVLKIYGSVGGCWAAITYHAMDFLEDFYVEGLCPITNKTEK